MSRALALLCLVLFVALFQVYAELSETQLRHSFGSFIVNHKRDYKTAEEYESRFQIFKANVLNAEKLTAMSKSATFGITKFSDWSPAERAEYLGKLPTNRDERTTMKAVEEKLTAPTTFDLAAEKLTPVVVDQGSCGSCWAFSTTFGVAASAISNGFYSQAGALFSQQQIVDCCTAWSGCNGGDLPEAYDYLSSFGGMQLDKDYPYTATDGRCKHNATQIAVPVTGFEEAIPFCKYSDCKQQDTQSFLAKMQTRKLGAAICVYVSNDWFDFQGGIFDLSCTSDYYSLNHCVGLTAYDAEKGSVTLQNSWGDNWAEGGFMRLKYIDGDSKYNNLCGWADEAVFAHTK